MIDAAEALVEGDLVRIVLADLAADAAVMGDDLGDGEFRGTIPGTRRRSGR